ncbi:UDP-N-acetylglucosamine diphosphorylase/glucosamine-1-phosphate N-acetyltransferase [Chitinophaga sp. CF118]|uniref:putative sugar nucleotidyl transferase n=1 Tax=Chitinophaga sp. CF118 TaxID=1884367 RepID=UPI0008ED55B4|nr:putative sugar nucleotidyl transferase [Chitinophaga sp. CF118]SFE87778.1 UDP-N-acetylglucosamine diphosphorylase/glucosamine-1-phosphate N-acetyltransferase [Chitinophaga sp. CF118]
MERNYILFDTPARDLLFPFTHTRPVAACRVGILTIREKWDRCLNTGTSYLTVPYLQEKYPLQQIDEKTVNVLINGHILPSEALIHAIHSLETGQELYQDNQILARVVTGDELGCIQLAFKTNKLGISSNKVLFTGLPKEEGLDLIETRVSFKGQVQGIYLPWDITLLNDQALRNDFVLLTKNRTSAPIPDNNQVSGREHVFLEPGAVVSHSILNATTGPIYIGRNAEIMEGCLIRGAFAMGEGATLKMGTKIYGATTLGPGCVGGGELKNVVMFGYSNKGHDGYLGDAVLGEWCNLGGNTTCSNLKNNGSVVNVWLEARKEAWPAGRKCGLLMGDYSRCGIGTMFNTGTVAGVSCNIFGGDFPPKFIPSFSWGGLKQEPYRIGEALRDAATWMQFKGQKLGEIEERLLKAVYELVNN